ncbi:Isochorismate synthase [Hahella chejuensis KCTC 2396]|uniref:isochorismate synthase n=1 Tax=Hahella chejuensis (strain KCTC 2396) TaxID=349521 RepID=Q2S823_HAHCH|nr:isochorismate synthase DhbC [Hahella chejuensis]ABC33201.1 Isochorismate synthase [Hahella chejuensis KCTC 2396]
MNDLTLHLEPQADDQAFLQLLKKHLTETPFFFSSPRQTLMTAGVFARLGAGDLNEAIPAALREAREQGIEDPMVVGAAPFLPGEAPMLTVPTRSWRRRDVVSGRTGVITDFGSYEAKEVPSGAGYKQSVNSALEHIRRGDISKVVLARSLELRADRPIDIVQLLTNLRRANPKGYNFAANLADAAHPRRFLVGASPELLVSRSGMRVFANPLAGSVARSPDRKEDARRAGALLQSEKDLHEHAVVIDAVAKALAPFCRNLDVPSTPSLTQTPTLWHLSTEITGELIDPAITSYALAQALHPTPAVCGYPTERARELIGELEPFNRGFFTGMVGWSDASGDGEWAVTIRCAEVEDRLLRLYAGAGVVEGSDPQKELDETSTKLKTMLNAIGLDSHAATPVRVEIA